MYVYIYFEVVVVVFLFMIEVSYVTPSMYVYTDRGGEQACEAHAHTSRTATPGKSWLSLGPVHVATLQTSHGHTWDQAKSRGQDPGKE